MTSLHHNRWRQTGKSKQHDFNYYAGPTMAMVLQSNSKTGSLHFPFAYLAGGSKWAHAHFFTLSLHSGWYLKSHHGNDDSSLILSLISGIYVVITDTLRTYNSLCGWDMVREKPRDFKEKKKSFIHASMSLWFTGVSCEPNCHHLQDFF